jgi:SAM-dependent methyltransferase
VIRRLRGAAAARLRRGWGDVVDAAESLRGGRGPLIPPRRLLTGDYGEFRELGVEFRDAFVREGGLAPDDVVLDVGCGAGRMAVPLTGFLSERARYEGFDLVRDEIRWCQEAITPRFPSFAFTWVDVRNPRYNPGGSIEASEFRFPYGDAVFDFAFLTSVFTHMLPDAVERYLAELRRTLRPSGRVFATWFLLNEESVALVEAGSSHYSFAHELGVARVNEADAPEAAVAYPEAWVRECAARRGLAIERTLGGYWCGRPHTIRWRWQDVAILRRADG